MRYYWIFVFSVLFSFSFKHICGTNLITNGGFESSTLSFTTDYTQNDPTQSTSPGHFYITQGKDQPYTSGDWKGSPHSGKQYMAVDASITPGKRVWQETITIQPHTTYNFTGYLSTITTGNYALINVNVNGYLLIDQFSAPTSTYTWYQMTALWYSDTSTSATIDIYDQNIEYGSNDFGLDDLSFAVAVFHPTAAPTSQPTMVSTSTLVSVDTVSCICRSAPNSIEYGIFVLLLITIALLIFMYFKYMELLRIIVVPKVGTRIEQPAKIPKEIFNPLVLQEIKL